MSIIATPKTISFYYDTSRRVFFNPRLGNRTVTQFNLIQRDLIYICANCVKDQNNVTLNSDSTVADSQVQDMSGLVNCITAIKTRSQYAQGSDFTQVFGGYSTEHPLFDLSKGRLVRGVAIMNATSPGDFLFEMMPYDVTGNPNTLGDVPMVARVIKQVVVGTEASIPPGSPSIQSSGTFTISGNSTTATVLIPTLTATTGLVNVWQNPPSTGGIVGNPISYCDDGQFSVEVPNPPGVGLSYNFGYLVVHL